jgi:hypothetical protein
VLLDKVTRILLLATACAVILITFDLVLSLRSFKHEQLSDIVLSLLERTKVSRDSET